jgi:hypothetical protein
MTLTFTNFTKKYICGNKPIAGITISKALCQWWYHLGPGGNFIKLLRPWFMNICKGAGKTTYLLSDSFRYGNGYLESILT